MEKHVIISVTSLQRDEDGKDEKISLETPGLYGEEGDMKYVTYKETKLAGMEGTTTTLRMYEDRVDLIREGSFTQNQFYRVGEKSRSAFRTPMGDLEVLVTTRELVNSIEKGEGEMRLSYDVELKGLFTHLNQIIVNVREDPEFHGS
ncbi:DUF1934 domain-containing protein [Dialister sp.]|uniref:DUF1934 domain-containing protein n=1 Tax=Dialister sp. TaxID=1955814 RepID=UPI002E80FC26|nr:DUF1934 domain-containing protein [Dialister sp.]MEE3452910.1 DUF1934 domain-containing protein [Dialister sp.]